MMGIDFAVIVAGVMGTLGVFWGIYQRRIGASREKQKQKDKENEDFVDTIRRVEGSRADGDPDVDRDWLRKRGGRKP